MKQGEPFNPWRGDDKTPGCGFNPADVVDVQHWLTDGQKRVYGRLVRFAGRDGHCYPSHETLSKVLGKSERQIRNDLKKLERVLLISHRNRDGRRSNTYLFLWHEMFEKGANSAQGGLSEEDLSGSTLPVNVHLERQYTSGQAANLTGSGLPVTGFERQDSVILNGSPLPGNSIQEFRNTKTSSPQIGESLIAQVLEVNETQPCADATRNAPASGKPRATAASLASIQDRWFAEEFWPHYWRKVDKAEALRMFRKHAHTGAAKDQIVEAVKAHAPYYMQRNPEHRPHASTWLNKRRYEEAPEETRQAVSRSMGPSGGLVSAAPPTGPLPPNADDYVRRLQAE